MNRKVIGIVVFEMLGGLEAEVVRLCESLYQAVAHKIQQISP